MSILAKSPDLTKIIKKAVERIGEDHAKSRDRKEDYHGITLKNEDLAIEKALKEASNEMAEKMVLENTSIHISILVSLLHFPRSGDYRNPGPGVLKSSLHRNFHLFQMLLYHFYF